MAAQRHLALVSVVVPVYNERECLAELATRLEAVFTRLRVPYELLFIDDGSKDGSFALIRSLHHTNKNIQGLRFSKNRGQQTALCAGFELAKGDVVISMDADLQHPPELIPDLLEHWKDGFDVVNTVKTAPARNSLVKKFFSKWFYATFNAVSDDLKLRPSSSDFRLLDRKCVVALNQITERLKFYRGLIEYIGFEQTTVEFVPPPRLAGTPSFTWRKSMVMGMDALFSFSTIGLKIPFIIGLVILALSVTYFIGAVFIELFTDHHWVRGWPSLLALSTLFFGAQFLFTGTIGLYVAKIFLEIKRRPSYFIADVVGLENSVAKSARPAPEPQLTL